MPYWLADLQDGLGPKHYTGGSRTPYGEDCYFRTMAETWTALRRLLRQDAMVVRLVAFPNAAGQMDRYLKMMATAGYERVQELEVEESRSVPKPALVRAAAAV